MIHFGFSAPEFFAEQRRAPAASVVPQAGRLRDQRPLPLAVLFQAVLYSRRSTRTHSHSLSLNQTDE